MTSPTLCLVSHPCKISTYTKVSIKKIIPTDAYERKKRQEMKKLKDGKFESKKHHLKNVWKEAKWKTIL
jgi:hypothetical protein